MICYMKKLLTIDELIAHMENKGIQFNIVSKEKAKHFLQEHNYYFKLASYRKNYDKYPFGRKAGKYKDLEFAYLKDLSTIDFHIRYEIIQMCLDIEHSLRTRVIRDLAVNPDEDGYNIVNQWDPNFQHRSKILTHLNTSYCKSLIEKYKPNFPAWVLLELLSFGELCKFVQAYDVIYPHRLNLKIRMLFPVRDIRNASAHNNCLIFDVREDSGINVTPAIRYFLYHQVFNKTHKRLCQNALNNKPIHDLLCLLYLYPEIVESEFLRKKRLIELKKLIYQRIVKHKEYYRKNAALKNTYKVVFKAFHYLQKKY